MTRERETDAAQAWLAANDEAGLAISEWVETEISSALSLKVRTGALGLDARAAALAEYRRVAARVMSILPVEPRHFRLAASFADRHDLGLRAGEALHLAVCADHGANLVTLDQRLLAAAPQLGVAAESP